MMIIRKVKCKRLPFNNPLFFSSSDLILPCLSISRCYYCDLLLINFNAIIPPKFKFCPYFDLHNVFGIFLPIKENFPLWNFEVIFQNFLSFIRNDLSGES